MSLLFLSGQHPSEPPFSRLENGIENGAKEVPTSPRGLFVEGWKRHWPRLLAILVPEASQQPCSVLPTQGMVLSAEYIKKKLEQEMVLSQAFGRDLVSFP